MQESRRAGGVQHPGTAGQEVRVGFANPAQELGYDREHDVGVAAHLIDTVPHRLDDIAYATV